jgi:hypothetical protein
MHDPVHEAAVHRHGHPVVQYIPHQLVAAQALAQTGIPRQALQQQGVFGGGQFIVHQGGQLFL